MSAALIDVTPLAKPVNACKWNAAQLRQTLKQAPANMPAEHRTRLEQSAAWLEQLATVVPFVHDNPVVLMAVGNLALSAKDRQAFLAALQQIDRATAEAQGVQTNGGGGWASVE